MRSFVFSAIEGARADGTVLRALREVGRAVNDLGSRVNAGSVTLAGGQATVEVPGLQATTQIVPGYEVLAGTPGTLYTLKAEYDVLRGRAVIRSTSPTDASTVSWVAVTQGV